MKKGIYIIAEAGVNHNGSLAFAKELIDVAVQAGADAVKFQTFSAKELSSQNAPKAEYQKTTTDKNESQYEMLKKLELDSNSYGVLKEHCDKAGIEFLSTPFDIASVDLLTDLSIRKVKVSSGDITNGPLLFKIARTGLPIILSTGMSTLGEIEKALAVLAFAYLGNENKPSKTKFLSAYLSTAGQEILRKKVSLLHCTTEYPAPFEEVNLNCMFTMKQAFGLPVGYSDHTDGNAVSIAAAALGANIIEKHFTLDKNLPGPDHKASLSPTELAQMVSDIRNIEVALGNGVKKPTPSEMKNRNIARKSLVAKCPIAEGEIFSATNITAKRPGDGVSPMDYWDLLGKAANRDYKCDEKV